MKRVLVMLSLSATLLVPITVLASSVEKAEMYRKHNLIEDAKRELIDVIYDSGSPKDKSVAYYQLGNVAFEENNVSSALDAWSQLVAKYPDTEQASIVKDRIKELAEFVGETSKSRIDNAVAQSYLRHADFWSERKSNVFLIDTSWIKKLETSVKWYDKVISEFPKSTAARIAYEGKLRALAGWEDPGKFGEKHGVMGNYTKYMPEFLSTFAAFEGDFPDAPILQAFRFQIAQQYWRARDWEKTKEWLNLVVTKSGPGDSFYKDLAQRRLEKIEY